MTQQSLCIKVIIIHNLSLSKQVITYAISQRSQVSKIVFVVVVVVVVVVFVFVFVFLLVRSCFLIPLIRYPKVTSAAKSEMFCCKFSNLLNLASWWRRMRRRDKHVLLISLSFSKISKMKKIFCLYILATLMLHVF